MSARNGLRWINRRALLLGSLASVGALVASCGQAAAPTVVPTVAPTPTIVNNPMMTTTVATAVPTQPPAPTQAAAPTQAPAPTQAAVPTQAPTAAATPAQTTSSLGPVSLAMGAWGNDVQGSLVQSIITAYVTKFPNVKVDPQIAPWANYWQKIQTQIASNTSPDVMMMSVAYIGNFVAKKVVLALDPYVQQDKLDLSRYWSVDVSTWRFAPGAKVGGQGVLGALSYDASINSTCFYNKTLFQKANVPLPSESWTWEKEVLNAAKALTNPSAGQWGMIAPYTADGAWTSMVWEWGGDTIDPTYSKGMLSQPEALAALKLVYDFVYTHKVSPPPNPAQKVDPFTTGKIGMFFANCNSFTSTYKDIKDFEWDIARWPVGPKGRFVEMEPDGYSIGATAKQPDQAFELLKFAVYDDDGTMRMSTSGTLPAIQSIATSDKYLKQPGWPPGAALTLKDIADGARSNYFGVQWAEWEAKSDTALQQAWLGKKPIDQAAKDADAAINQALQNATGALF